mgnify:CR=1 FL=1
MSLTANALSQEPVRYTEPPDELKELLEEQKVSLKVGMRSKWYKSDAPALQIALMKIISTEDEAHRLNGTRQEIKTEINDKRQGFIEPIIE